MVPRVGPDGGRERGVGVGLVTEVVVEAKEAEVIGLDTAVGVGEIWTVLAVVVVVVVVAVVGAGLMLTGFTGLIVTGFTEVLAAAVEELGTTLRLLRM